MIFDLSISKKAAHDYIDNLICKIDIIKLFPKRTGKQNRYQHLAFSWFAIQAGYTREYVKQTIYKKWVNPEIFITKEKNEKTGEYYENTRSTSDLDTKETEICLARFRMYAAKGGIDIREPNDTHFWDHVQNEIEKHKEWL